MRQTFIFNFCIAALLIACSAIELKAKILFAIQTPTSTISAVQATALTASIGGVWNGTLEMAGLRLRLNVKDAANGKLTATLDSLDQNANGIPVDSIALEARAVKFEIKVIGAKYEGTLSVDNQEIVGTFTQGGAALPLTFKRTDKPSVINRPQNPQPPFPYDAEEVSYKNVKDDITLGGTLTLPRDANKAKRFPAVLLITGSGAQDRDESLMNHKPFLVLADYLTRRGIAVLRVDDRGVGKTTGDFSKATSEDFARDALAGVEFLKTHTRVDAQKIGLVGHSEGGMIAPMVSVQSKDVAFIVLMAGTGVSGEEILLAQAALIGKASGASDKDITRNRTLQQRLFVVLRAEQDAAVREKKLRDVMQTFAENELSADEKKTFTADRLNAEVNRLSSVWIRFFTIYDPRPTLRKVRVPVLAINGERDLQVPAKDNLREIEKALKAGGNKDVTVIELPKLNHLFQTSTTGALEEYARIEETIAPQALKTIGDWIAKRTGSN